MEINLQERLEEIQVRLEDVIKALAFPWYEPQHLTPEEMRLAKDSRSLEVIGAYYLTAKKAVQRMVSEGKTTAMEDTMNIGVDGRGSKFAIFLVNMDRLRRYLPTKEQDSIRRKIDNLKYSTVKI